MIMKNRVKAVPIGAISTSPQLPPQLHLANGQRMVVLPGNVQSNLHAQKAAPQMLYHMAF